MNGPRNKSNYANKLIILINIKVRVIKWSNNQIIIMKPIIILNILTVITKVKDMQLIIMQAVKIILSDRLSINLNLLFVLETSVFSNCV